MASRGINKVILVGNLGKDPETRYMPNGNAVTNVTLATSVTWKDQSGQMQEKTEWHRVVFFRRLAEVAGEYLKKGSKIYVEGRLQTNKWQDQSGNDRYTTEIVVNEMQMLDSRGGGGGDQGYDGFQQQGSQQNQGFQPPPTQNQSTQQSTQNQSTQQSTQQSPQPATADGGVAQGFDSFDDDIPF